jgi:hypothetical protein
MEHLPDEALAMHHTGPPIPRVRMVWEFSLAVVMQAAQVAAMMVALVYWFVSNANRGEDNQRRLAEFQTNVSGQITELIQWSHKTLNYHAFTDHSLYLLPTNLPPTWAGLLRAAGDRPEVRYLPIKVPRHDAAIPAPSSGSG